jgi:glutamine amidotransferase-like uncharacterized protein
MILPSSATSFLKFLKQGASAPCSDIDTDPVKINRMIRSLFLFLLFSLPLVASTPEGEIYAKYPFQGTPLPDQYTSRRNSSPLVGLYVGKGVWDVGREHLKLFLKSHAYSYRTLDAKAVQNGQLQRSRISLLILPGGESSQYLPDLGARGAQQIKDFVARGGGYIGICAGAFYATSLREGGNATGPWGIGLLEGTAYDGTALHTPPFIEGMMDFDFMPHPTLTGLQPKFRLSLFGGPALRFSEQEAAKKNLAVLARFPQIHDPAMVLFQYGRGHVFLSAPHLEVEENLTHWGQEFYDPESEWPILDRMVAAVRRRAIEGE